MASVMIFAAGLFDFFDGFTARLLNAHSPIGGDLDSLSDVVSFGVAPGFIMYHVRLLRFSAASVFGSQIGEIQRGYTSNHFFHWAANAADGHLHGFASFGLLAVGIVGPTSAEPLSVLGYRHPVFSDDGLQPAFFLV